MSQGSLRTPLARVRGLGSAKGGTHHFWIQRLTAIALVPLTNSFCQLLKCKLLRHFYVLL